MVRSLALYWTSKSADALAFISGTDGNINVAMNAINAASNGHYFLSVTKQGLSAIVQTEGNDACHVILRGGQKGPNHDVESVAGTAETLCKAKLRARVMMTAATATAARIIDGSPLLLKLL